MAARLLPSYSLVQP